MASRSVYGYCPIKGCTSKGVSRERRINGNDTCNSGHVYPSLQARNSPQKKKKVAVVAPKVETKKLVNNVIFVIDCSTSMQRHRDAVNRVFKSLVEPLKQSGFPTRVSLYTFANRVNCEFFMESNLERLSNFALYANGMTALIDGSYTAISDHQSDFLVSKKNEDNTFLLYVITDGEENQSRHTAGQLRTLIDRLGDSWTVATMVPNQSGVHYAKNCGFPAGNIAIWDTSSERGFEDAGVRLQKSYADYTTARSLGVRSTTNLFTVDASNVTKADVKANLVEGDGRLIRCYQPEPIRDFVERTTGKPYKIGSAFYELTKREKVQPQKEVAIVSQDGKKKYFGDSARQMLGLDVNQHIKVVPGDHGDWRIFIQSTSVNRKVVPGQSILLRE